MKLTEFYSATASSPRLKYRVTLTDEERTDLQRLVWTGRGAARTLPLPASCCAPMPPPAARTSPTRRCRCPGREPVHRRTGAPAVRRGEPGGRPGAQTADRAAPAQAEWRSRSTPDRAGLP